jgi:hypothetical protein
MRAITRLFPALALSALLAGGAGARGFGRPGGQGFRMGGGSAALLMAPDVQKELKLTDTQKTQVRGAIQKSFADAQALFQQGQNGSQEERMQAFQKLQAEQQKTIDGILNPDQRKRLHEILLQQQGGMALANPEVASELKLTDDQKTKLGATLQQQSQAMRDLFQSAGNAGGGPGGFGAIREKMQALQKDTSAKITALLTDEQQKQWKEMQGAPFAGNLVPVGPGGRPGGFRPGGAGGR